MQINTVFRMKQYIMHYFIGLHFKYLLQFILTKAKKISSEMQITLGLQCYYIFYNVISAIDRAYRLSSWQWGQSGALPDNTVPPHRPHIGRSGTVPAGYCRSRSGRTASLFLYLKNITHLIIKDRSVFYKSTYDNKQWGKNNTVVLTIKSYQSE